MVFGNCSVDVMANQTLKQIKAFKRYHMVDQKNAVLIDGNYVLKPLRGLFYGALIGLALLIVIVLMAVLS